MDSEALTSTESMEITFEASRSADADDPKEALKAMTAEKQRVEQALVAMRIEFDEYRKMNEAEKRRLAEEKEQTFATLKEILVQRGPSTTRTDSVTEAETSDEEDNPSPLGDSVLFEKRKALVQKTWKAVQESLSVDAAKAFYKRLFAQHPGVTPLFAKADMDALAEKLYQTLSVAVECLDDVDALIPKLEELGARHALAYKAERPHYDAVGDCLLATLKAGLGEDAWTKDVADAWAWVYTLVSKVMADAGEKALVQKRKAIVQRTWKAVENSVAGEATKIFYKHLFEKHPTVIPLFGKGDIEVQAAKLYQTLSLAVQSLDDIDSLVPTLEELGERHAISFQTERAHYDAVGECLLWTLESGLGDAWTEEAEDAWGWVYGVISKTMADAGDRARAKSDSSPEKKKEDDGVDRLFEKRRNLVQATWKQVEQSLSVEATKIFYKRLFDQYPSVVPLFKGDMDAQADMLYKTIGFAVESLHDVDALIPALQELGAKHGDKYQTEREHYDAVGECLIWTLKTGLGEAWTDDVADAWGWVYGVISKTMADAGEKAVFERRKKLVQQTWKTVEDSLSVEATKLFYKRLFDVHPTVIPLFSKGDIELQAAKLYQTLSLAVGSLDDVEGLVPTLEELGRRHAVQFQTERAHYDAVGECLLWTLEKGLGDAWTESVADAWAWVYGVVSKAMADAGDKAVHEREKKKEAKAAKKQDLPPVDGAVQALEKALFDLRVQHDDKVKLLEAENRRLVEEKEKTFDEVRAILVAAPAATPQADAVPVNKIPPPPAPVATREVAAPAQDETVKTNLELISSVSQVLQAVAEEFRARPENSRMLEKIEKLEKEKDENIKTLASLKAQVDSQTTHVERTKETESARFLAESLISIQHEDTKKLLVAFEEEKKGGYLWRWLISGLKIGIVVAIFVGLLYLARTWDDTMTASMCAPVHSGTRITEDGNVYAAPYWVPEKYKERVFHHLCGDSLPRIQLELKHHTFTVTELKYHAGGDQASSGGLKHLFDHAHHHDGKHVVSKHQARVAYVSHENILLVDSDGKHREIPIPWGPGAHTSFAPDEHTH